MKIAIKWKIKDNQNKGSKYGIQTLFKAYGKPIEMVWGIMKQRIIKLKKQPTSPIKG